VSVGLLALALQAQGVPAVSYAGWQVPVQTDSAFTKARISQHRRQRVRADLAAGKVVIITGFQGIDPQGNVTTLGRGGSDTSAVAVAAALKADECLIYTDVDGVYTTDPRIVPEARRLPPSASKRCWKWPAWAARCCRSARWNLPASTACPCACCRSFTPWDIPSTKKPSRAP
jgi:aspartate kinase